VVHQATEVVEHGTVVEHDDTAAPAYPVGGVDAGDGSGGGGHIGAAVAGMAALGLSGAGAYAWRRTRSA
jgi:hypothetical protein